MALHLLVTTNLNRRIVSDIDFRLLLKLSQDQCLILDQSVLTYFGNAIPNRTVIAVGQSVPDFHVDHLVCTVDAAIDRLKSLNVKDAVAIGFTRRFNKRILSHADVLHHHTIDCTKDRNHQVFPMISSRQWSPLHTEHIGAKPLCRSVAIVKRSFKRMEYANDH